MSKNKIKPIYTELQGYLAQAPSSDKASTVSDSSLWQQFNNTIDELNKISNNNYDKFKITNINQGARGPFILNSDYRSKLNGLIMRLYGEYFETESSPISGSPSTIVSQNQSQSQTTRIAMIMDFQSLIDEKLYSSELNEKEKTFLEKIKVALPSVKSFAEITSLIINIAKSLGISVDQLSKIFGQ